MTRRFNFSPGPAVLPEPVLAEARENLLSLKQSGIGILETSHRGPEFGEVIERARQAVHRLAGIPEAGYHVLFLQGGASLQFAMVPWNLLFPGAIADYLVSGCWSQKAVAEAERIGRVHVAATSEPGEFRALPTDPVFSDNPAYVHFTSNNTVVGTQFADEPDIPDGTLLVCDASSDLFSRPIDVTRCGLIYAGAQKNLGPAGLTLVIVRDDLLGRAPDDLPDIVKYRVHARDRSLYNTPPTFAVYVTALVLEWIESEGGLAAMATRSREKAGRLYDFLDASPLFRPRADAGSRSLMNVTFSTGDEDVDQAFLARAGEAGLAGLAGHRSVRGLRASLYNALPVTAVDRLLDLMSDFEAKQST